MDQEIISKFIKDIRQKNNLTQKEFAEKYNVTYQAVSKWENGKNLPDTLLLKQMSKDFNISLDELFSGKDINKKKLHHKLIYFLVPALVILLLISILLLIKLNKDSNFEFKTVTTSCSEFKISGSVAYNDNKSAIYINNIEYCGGNDTTEYKNIECTLYEVYDNIDKKISSNTYEIETPVTLENYLKNVTFTVDNYLSLCHSDDTELYLEINATNSDNKITTYKIPLSLETCSSNSNSTQS